MSEPYECAQGVCRDVVSWSPMGIAAAVVITGILVFITLTIVEQIRRK